MFGATPVSLEAGVFVCLAPRAGEFNRPQGGTMQDLTQYLAVINTRVHGIPCRIGVTDYEPFVPAYTDGPPELCTPEEPGLEGWEILDRRGRLAQWIMDKMSEADDFRIGDEIVAYMQGRTDDAAVEAALDRLD